MYSSSYNDIRKDHRYTIDNGVTVNLGFSRAVNEAIEKNFPVQRADTDFFAFWCYTISCPAALVVLVLHLILHDLYIFGVIVRQQITALWLCTRKYSVDTTEYFVDSVGFYFQSCVILRATCSWFFVL